MAARGIQAVLAVTGTALGLVWLYPEGAVLTLGMTLGALLLPFALRRALVEVNLRLQTQGSALERFYLDALIGASPIRAHGAERAVQIEYEELLTQWALTARDTHRLSTAFQGVQLLLATVVGVALPVAYMVGVGDASKLLLLAFWALKIPMSAQEIALSHMALQNLRALALRLMSPLAARATADASQLKVAEVATSSPRGVTIEFEGVSAAAGGQTIIEDVSLNVPGGTHVAVVGASGAGKSSLLGLLLGWLEPSSGRILVDGQELTEADLPRLRSQIGWVDPAVALWERSLYENVAFGEEERSLTQLPEALRQAEVLEILEGLPDGLQSNLGEGGGRLSGGQGQRVRFARALLRQSARLVILDEPFRGLERERRKRLLSAARKHWSHATLVFVSHDVEDTLQMDRVLVIDGGKVVEDGNPQRLVATPGTAYRQLVESATTVSGVLRSSPTWRRVVVSQSQLTEAPHA
jgi:ATP-binding cassette subfamily B protein